MEYGVLESMFASHVHINNVDINDHYSSLVGYDVETYSPQSDSRTRISKSRLTFARRLSYPIHVHDWQEAPRR